MAVRAGAEFQETIRVNDDASAALGKISSNADKTAESFAYIQSEIGELTAIKEVLKDIKELNLKTLNLNTQISDFSREQVNAAKQVQQNNIQLEDQGLFFDIASGAVKTFGLAVASVGIFKLAMQFDSFRAKMGPFLNDLNLFKKSFSEVDSELSPKISGSFFRIGETLWTISKPLGMLSALLTQVDSQFLNFVGTAGLATSAAGALFGLFVSMGIKSIAGLSESIGDFLLSSITAMEEKFEKAEGVFKQFSFTIQGLGKTLGESVVGGIDIWTNKLAEMQQETKFSTESIAKSIKLLVSEGIRLGLNQDQVGEIISRTSDIASAFGEDISETASKINSAFAGNSQSLQQMGMAVSDADFVHSQFFLSLGKTADQLSKAEKAAVRFDLIMHESQFTAGASAAAIMTLAGANAVLDRSINDLQVKLGASGDVYRTIIGFAAKFVQVITDLPDPIIDVISFTQEWIGISLKISGILLSQFITITTVAFAYKLLSIQMATNATIQAGLTSASIFLGNALGVQTIAVTSLGTAWTNLVIIMQAMLANVYATLISSLKTISLAILAAAKAVGVFTLSLLTNPLFIKGALIAGSIFLVYRALRDLVNEVPFIRELIDSLKKSFSNFFASVKSGSESSVNVFSYFTNVTKSFFSALVALTKTAIGSFLTFFAALGRLRIEAQRAFEFMLNGFRESSEAFDKWENKISQSDEKLAQLSKFTSEAFDKINILKESQAQAATATNDFNQSLQTNAELLDRLVKLNLEGFDTTSERIKIMGSDFEKVNLAMIEATKKLEAAKLSNIELDQKSKDIAEATKEQFTAILNVEKLGADTLKKISEDRQQLNLDQLKASGKNIAAIKLETKIRLDAFDEQIDGLQKIADLTDDQIKQINDTRKAIEKSGLSKIYQEQKKNQEEALKGIQDAQKIIEEVETARIESAKNLFLITASESERTKIQTASEMFSLGLLRNKIDLSKDLTKTQKEQLRAIVDQSEALKLQASEAKLLEDSFKRFLDIQSSTEQVRRELRRLDMDAVELIEDELSHQLDLIQLKQNELMIDKERNANALKSLSLQAQYAREIAARRIEAAEGGPGLLAGLGASIMGAATDIQKNIVDPIKELGRPMDIGLGVQETDFDFSNLADNLDIRLRAVFDNLDISKLGSDLGKFLFEAFDAGLTFLVDNAGTIFEAGAFILGGGIAEAFAGVLDSLANIGDVWLEAFNKIDKAIVKLVNTLPKALQEVIKRLPEIAKRIAESLPMIARALADAAPALTEAIVKAMPQVIIAIGQGLSILAKALPAVVEQIAKGLPDIILAIAKAVPQVIQAFVEAMPAIAEALADNAGPIAEALTIALVAGSADIAAGIINEMLFNGGLERIGGAIARGLRDAFLGIVSGMGKLLSGAMPKIKVADIDALDDAAQKLKDALSTDQSALFKVSDLMDEATSQVNNQAAQLQGAITQAMGKSVNLLKEALNAMLGLWRKFWDGIVELWRGLWDTLTNLWRGLWDGLTTAWRAVWDAVGLLWQGMLTGLSEAWKVIFSLLKTLWTELTNLLGPIFQPLTDFANKLGGLIATAFEPVLKVFGGATPALIATVLTAFDPVLALFAGKTPALIKTVSDAFKPVLTVFAGTSPTLVTTVANAFGNVASYGTKMAQALWDSLTNWNVGSFGTKMAQALWDSLTNWNMGAFGVKIGQDFWNALTNWNTGIFGQNMAQSFWDSIRNWNPANIGEQMAAGLWNTISGMNWSSLIGGSGGGVKLPFKMATGGVVPNMPIQYLAPGGLARGTDTVPAMLTPGEFIVNRKAASENMGALRNLNNGGSLSSSVVIQKIEINGANMTADQIASQVIPKIDQHLKRKSQDGGFVLAKSGIRGI